MNSPVLERLLQAVDLELNLLPFLKYSGWEQIDEQNGHWIVMHGNTDIYGQPLELVFPQDRKSEVERRSYIQKAVELLTAERGEPIQLLVQSIISYDRDILYVRNTETEGGKNTIPLNFAIDQIQNLKRTIEYSATSEREVKPYFQYVNPIAKKVFKEFLFGHTFAGSFGFTVEAPQLPDPSKFYQHRLDLGDDFTPPVDVPFSRRIMERIARGLKLTKQAEDMRNHTILLDEYPSGFNSNMCTAVVGMSKEMRATVEFRIAWSPKIKPGEDVSNPEPVKLQRNGYEMLTYVAKELKTLEPQFATITGHVRALTSSDNPLSLGTRRAVVLRGVIPGRKRPTDIIVELEREDYAIANKAHIDWDTVQISGVLSRSGAAWRLLNVRDLKLLH